MNALSPFLIAVEALLSNTNTPALAVVGVYHAFLNNDTFIDSLSDRQFDWFMLFGSTLYDAYR
jgi:hypothetical protein